MRNVGGACFGATVITGCDEGGRTCANGLPVVPASVRMLGRFQVFKDITHPSLCQYIDIIRCNLAPNSVILIAEHHVSSLSNLLSSKTPFCSADAAFQIATGIEYLHRRGLFVGTLSPHSVRCFVEAGRTDLTFRLSQYGMSYVTRNGMDAANIANVGYGVAPEQLLSSADKRTTCTVKTDVWSFGILLLEMALGIQFEDIWSFEQYAAVLSSAMKSGNDCLLDYILNALKSATPTGTIDSFGDLRDIIAPCLSLLPSKRPSSQYLWDVLAKMVDHEEVLTSSFEMISDMEARIEASDAEWKLKDLRLDDAFFLWKLCGSSPESILIKAGVIHLQYPIITTPSLIVEDFRMLGNDDGRKFRVTGEPFILSIDNLRQKLLSLDDAVFMHSIELDGLPVNDSTLSVIVKEKNVEYQLKRTLLVRHLVDGNLYYPGRLAASVSSDVPPLTRASVWAALLGVRESDSLTFLELDTLATHSSDRQLDVDIPRCHQYEELLTSPAAHWRLRRLLKGWLLSHPQYVYWQGCDSLAAPFLLLNFNNIPTALASLTAFIKKYLFGFFLKDNSAIIQEYLAVFNHLLAYVDSSLYNRLAELDFYPELFAIPWFLTCFAHVLPLHKLLHVWDVLILKDSSFPLFVGLAILKQLRNRLIDASFNDAILLFSDLPDLSMERVVFDSLYFFERVPPSCSFRTHSNHEVAESPISDDPRSLPCSLATMSHHELKTWSCPRMSSEEMAWRVHRQSIAVVDIRSQQEFNRASVIRSISYSNPSDDSLLNISEALRAAQRNQHPICIVGGKDVAVTKKFTEMLVKKCIDGVCVLDGGFEAVRSDETILGLA